MGNRKQQLRSHLGVSHRIPPRTQSSFAFLALRREFLHPVIPLRPMTPRKISGISKPTMTKYPYVSYSDYLKISDLITLQQPKSREYGQEAFDETLFIITHQTYELWFKQILHELDGVLKVFSASVIEDSEMGWLVQRFDRIHEIQKVMLQQIDVLQTMTPLDFLDFRHFLYPASGFQSFQFRLIENKFGLRPSSRQNYNAQKYNSQLSPEERVIVEKCEKDPSLFDLVERWLERTPLVNAQQVSLWESYKEAVNTMFDRDEQSLRDHPLLGEEERTKNLKMIEDQRATFLSFSDPVAFKKMQEAGGIRLSFSAARAALLIQLYRDLPLFQLPFRLLTALIDLDETFTTWRYRHALMAHRMLGRKIGTGGSSGHDYLRSATESHKVYSDFVNLATFLIPRSELPKHPSTP